MESHPLHGDPLIQFVLTDCLSRSTLVQVPLPFTFLNQSLDKLGKSILVIILL